MIVHPEGGYDEEALDEWDELFDYLDEEDIYDTTYVEVWYHG